MIVGGYSLHLYCDSGRKQPYNTKGHTGYNPGDTASFRESSYPDEYAGKTRAECIRQARKAGWLIGKERQVCPTCRKGAR